MTDRPLRFGVSTSSAADRDEWRQRARQYEAMGFDTLVVADHLGGVLSPMTALLAAADATERLRIGTFVLNNDFWSPLLLAREAVTLDLLSGGRLELGLGAGHAQEEYEAAGLRYDPPAVRVARLAETVPLLRRLLDGETVDHEGAHVTLRQATVGVAGGAAPDPAARRRQRRRRPRHRRRPRRHGGPRRLHVRNGPPAHQPQPLHLGRPRRAHRPRAPRRGLARRCARAERAGADGPRR